ncbi:MAG: hypothetical protein QMC77_08390 [Methanocellales archaeon]|nr:hypothetical protein [Methanocellales archaeon]
MGYLDHITTSWPSRNQEVKLREKPWLKVQPWHTEKEKERLRRTRERLYENTPKGREWVYKKPTWMKKEETEER